MHMAQKKAAPKVPKKAKQIYFVELPLGGTVYHGGGETAAEALDALTLAVPAIEKKLPKTKSVMTITKDGKAHQKYFYVAQLRRFFTNALNRQLLAKTFTNALG